jgi:hypothetical protein
MSYKFNPFTGTFDIASSPGGSTTQVQFNDGGSFGGASQLTYDKARSFTGVQQSSPLAPLHVTGAIGTQVPTPSGFTATLIEDIPVTVPISGSVTAMFSSPPPVIVNASFIYIDYATSGSASQNTSNGNYVCNGQTIYYRLYPYTVINGTKVCNPQPWSFNFTDTINDGSTVFKVDITGIGTSSGNWEGIILAKSFDGYNYNSNKDIGTASSYTDNNFTDNDSFEFTQYSDGNNQGSVTVYQYKNINGTNYVSDAATGFVNDPGNGQALVLYVTLSNLSSADGFEIYQSNGYFRNIGTDTSYYDWGSFVGTIDPYSSFLDVAFPIMSTNLTGATSTTASFNYGSGSYTADSSYWAVSVWEYFVHPESGQHYYLSSPNTYFLGTDNGTNNNFNISWSTNPGNGSGRVVVVNRNGTDIYEEDVGGATSGTLSGTGSITNKLDISLFNGIVRNFSLYGKITFPTNKYSNSAYTYSITGPNSAPYILVHSLPSAGNATNFKIIESSYRNGSVYDGYATGTAYQIFTSVGDTVSTPSSIGFLSNGTNLNRTYAIYTSQTSGGVVGYSGTPATISVTDPHNGKYYSINLTWDAVANANYKLKRTFNTTVTYHVESSLSYADSTVATWSDSSTVTPSSLPVTGAIIERFCNSFSNPATLTIRNTLATNLNFVVFDFLSSGSVLEAGRFGIDTSGQFFLQSNAGNLIVGSSAQTSAIIGTETVLNYLNSSSGYFTFKGPGNNYISYFDANYGTAFFGFNRAWTNTDPFSAVCIAPQDSFDAALVISTNPTASNNSTAVKLVNSNQQIKWIVTNDGRTGIGTSVTGSGVLRLGPAESGIAQIEFTSSNTNPSVAGGITYYQSNFWGGDDTGTMRRFLYMPATYGTGSFTYVDSNGYLIADNRIYWNGSYLAAAQLMLFTQGISITSTKSISMGTGSSITGNIIFNYVAKNANYTLAVGDYCINVTASGKIMTLPTAVGKTGQIYVIKATYTSSTGTVNTTSSQTIFTTSAVTSVTMNAGDTLRVMSNGSNWIAI